MKKWNCSKEDRKHVIEIVRYNYNRMKEEKTENGVTWYFCTATGNIQMACVNNFMTYGLFEAYHDVLCRMRNKKMKEIRGW